MFPGALWVLTAAAAVSVCAASTGLTPGVPGEGGTARSSCPADQFSCADGSRCIPLAWKCDTRSHCDDGSDEIDCAARLENACGAGQFRCSSSGRCIPAAWRCDGDHDCGPKDHSDEDPHMCEKNFKCRGNWARCATPVGGQFSCLPIEKFCDNTPDCPDNSDEWDICDHWNTSTSACARLNCSSGSDTGEGEGQTQGCRPTHEGARCYCRDGYEYRHRRCQDTDECALADTCPQQCANTAGSFVCSCVAGYTKLQNNGLTQCKAINEPPDKPTQLIVVTESDIRLVSTSGREIRGNHTVPALNVKAFDFHYSNNTICYIHHIMGRSSLVCMRADDFNNRTAMPLPKLFPDVASVSHMAIDWISNNWYMYDSSRGVLFVCSEDLQSCRRLVDNLDKLRGLAVDPTRGEMYWSVWGASPPAVYRADLAGTSPAPLPHLALVYPGPLALDLPTGALYWADTYRESLERHLNDTRRTFRHRLSQKLQGVDTFETRVYIPVWNNNSVEVSETVGRGALLYTVSVAARPLAVRVYHRMRQPEVKHPCASNRGGCAHICVTSYRAGAARAQCLCRHGYRLAGRTRCIRAELSTYLLLSSGSPPLVRSVSLDPARWDWEPAAPVTDVTRPTAIDVDLQQGFIYYADVHRYEIGRQKLDGSGHEIYMGQFVNNCEGLAVDWMGRNLYWTDDALGEVSVARLQNPSLRRVLIHEANYNPRAIALDPANGMMYWSVWGGGGTGGGVARIETAYMSGESRHVLVDTDLHWPNGLALDYETHYLYWCDTYLNKIERMNIATGERSLVVKDADDTPVKKPYGLALHDGEVLWSEHDTGAVRTVTAGHVTVMREYPPPLYDLKMITDTTGTGKNECSLKNGGCAELCLATPQGRKCMCKAGYTLAVSGNVSDVTHCVSGSGADARSVCGKDMFYCKDSGKCIKQSLVCDGDADCRHAEDEDDSPTGPCANMTCRADQFKCDNRCFPQGWLCDGYKDCSDGTDEALGVCGRAVCSSDQFQCAVTRRCIPAAWRCDAARDCGPGDHSDELHCAQEECSSLMFKCGGGGGRGGACIPAEYYCDGTADCADASDERNCPETLGDFTEQISTHRAHSSAHAHDSDKMLCEDHEFQCDNGECIRKEFRCDSRVDCLDGSDETVCGPASSPSPPTPTTSSTNSSTCPPPALVCDTGRCVPLRLQCDGVADCQDGSDEADRCGEPMCTTAACSDECHPSPAGPVCLCGEGGEGRTLAPDGYTCVRHTPCQQWGICDQVCEPYKSRHKCICYEDYKLADDGFTCKSTLSDPPLLVFSNRHEIRGLYLPGGGGGGVPGGAGAGGTSRALLASLKNTVALDWGTDALTGKVQLYWTDVVDDNIYRGTLVAGALSGIEEVVQSGLAAAEGLAVDWIANNLYWVESSLHQIEVSRCDGAHRRTLLAGDMDSPRAIATDPTKGYLFWTDWEQSAPRIERSTLAGRERVRLVRVDVLTEGQGAWPNGLTLDHRAERLYWIDARSDSIHTTTYAGTHHVTVLRSHELLSHPFAMTVFESRLYWTDWRANCVASAGKYNGSDVSVVQRTLTQPFDIKVIHPSRQPRGSHNPCAINNGNCSHLCLIDTPSQRVCACPHVMKLAEDQITCEVHEKVLLVGRLGEIRGVELSSPSVHMIPTVSGSHLAAPAVLHFLADNYTLYWADTETNEIKRTGLTRGPITTMFDTGVENPRGLAVDWLARLIYYTSSRPTGDRLTVATLKGEYSTTVYPDDDALSNVSALAVHPVRGKLYWSHSPEGRTRIETANCDGGARRVLLHREIDDHLGGVTSLVVDMESDRLYWVNTASATIQYYDLNNKRLHTIPLGLGARPSALEVYSGEVYWADAEDATLRACGKDLGDKPRVLLNNTDGVISLRVYDAAVQRAGKGRGACSQRHSQCRHLCLPVSESDSVCRCATGYIAKGADCVPLDEVLMYSVSWEVRGLMLNTTLNSTEQNVLAPLAQLSMAEAIDYHAEGGWLYWTDSETGSLWRAGRDGTRRTRVRVQPDMRDTTPDDWIAGVAVDWVSGNVYWSDPRRRLVECARLDGAHQYVLIDTDLIPVTELSVDPYRGWLFMSGAGYIQRASLDGTNLQLLYNGTAVSGITLDIQNEYVYWSESRSACISRSRYDGSQRSQLLCDTPLRHPVALTYHRGTLYWLDTNMEGGSIVSAPVTNLTQYTVMRHNLGASLKDLFIWSSIAQQADTVAVAGAHNNTCAVNNGGCAHLCLYNSTHALCKCPHGDLTDDHKNCTPYATFIMFSHVTKIESLHLSDQKELNSPYPPIQNKELMRNAIGLAYDYNASRIFYSDIQSGSINTVMFDGSNHHVLLEQVGAVEGMVYEPTSEYLYWTCSSSAAVRRAHVADLEGARGGSRGAGGGRGGRVETVLRLPSGERPRGIDVDPCDSRVYWTNWNSSHPSLQRSYLNGYRVQTIISTQILMPNGLSLDHATRRLYWADARLDKIERCRYDGSHRFIVTTTGTSHPFALSAWRGAVYWTDWVSSAVWSVTRGGTARPLRTGLARPMAITLVLPRHHCTPDPCAVLNGGCSQICSLEHTGRSVCTCHAGMQLSPDGHTCRPDNRTCPTDLFECADGKCIPDQLLCDGIAHCTDGSDEDLFYCTSRSCDGQAVSCGAGGRCVPAHALCDGHVDCDDATDETGCRCPDDHYTCETTGTCVEMTSRCDGVEQCEDGSDETNCPAELCATLGPTAIACDSPPSCYLPEWRCDNKTDCPDGSDEAHCTLDWSDSMESWSSGSGPPEYWCSEDQFRCGSPDRTGAPGIALECIPAAWRCDGRRDCSDGSDEAQHCHSTTPAAPSSPGSTGSTCSPAQLRCGNGACIALTSQCDGRADCPAGEDEEGCACPAHTTRCAHSDECLDASEYCDGDVDCADGSDEPPGCSPATPAAPPDPATPAPPAPSAAPLRHPLCGEQAGSLYCSGRCLSSELVCDGRDHCQDGGGGGAGTDEDPAVCAASFVRSFHVSTGWTAAAVTGRCGAGEWRCGAGHCISLTHLCDTVDHCGDYTDEMFCGTNECLYSNGGCAHNCTDLPVGATCWCRAGWRRGGAGERCQDVDECQEDQPCAHDCRNTQGSFVCTCREGYKLMSDGINCAPLSEVKPTLIFTNRYYIRRSWMSPAPDTEHSTLLVHNLTNAVALDYDWAGGCLYWSDVTRPGSSIKRLCGVDPQDHLINQKPGELPKHKNDSYQLLHGITLHNPDGLAVDWVGGNLYWCDKGTDTIEVSLLDGRHRRVIVSKGLQEPRAIALHPHTGMMYWSDWGNSAHIGRAGMDGSSQTVIISSGLGWPNALVVSHASSELYFADAREDYIAVADLDGKHVQVLFDRDHSPWLRLHHVFALSEWGGRLYWSDWETRALESCRRRPLSARQYSQLYKKHSNSSAWEVSVGGAYECGTVAHTIHKPMDLRVYHPARQPPIPELSAACASLNCSGLCLLSPSGEAGASGTATVACACPEHWVLQTDQRTCRPNCSAAHFVCETALKCIPFWWRCDTQDDCGDGSDEGGSCPVFRCAPGEFQCEDGVCLHPARICDGTAHCAHREDEINCDKFTCLSGQFKCSANSSTGVGARCLPSSRRCDNVPDCHDGADELDCPPRTCPPHHFTCGNGSCVSLVWSCDGDADCADASDEGAWCAGRDCPPHYHRCANGRCVPTHWLCDGEADCPSAEDERGCGPGGAGAGPGSPVCEATYFRCRSGRCIPGRWRCDYEEDCDAGEDEADCKPRNCSETEFRCGSGECIRSSHRCSGTAQCPDRSDEAGCATDCPPNTRHCNNTTHCVLHEWWCDGEVDCGDGSDEANCDPPAGPGEGAGAVIACSAGGGAWRCGGAGGGACMPPSWRCDGRADCSGAGDEGEQCAQLACMPDMIRCDDNTCVSSNLVCDGVADCSDGADERPNMCGKMGGVRSSVCADGEQLCHDARCLPSHLSCLPESSSRVCEWRSCPQLCLSRLHHNHTCKCASGYKQRVSADGLVDCEIMGGAGHLLAASEGSVLLWELMKLDHEPRVLYTHEKDHNVQISSVVGGLVGKWWCVWWADEAHGNIYALNASRSLTSLLGDDDLVNKPEIIVRSAGAIRSLAVDWSTHRIYWTTAGRGAGRGGAAVAGGRSAAGGVYSARLEGGMQLTHYQRDDAYLDHIVINNDTREMFWTDVGPQPGVYASSLSASTRGGGVTPPSRVLRRRLRRPQALALDRPSRRLYLVDTYYDVLETIQLDGRGRALVGYFDKTPRVPHYNVTKDGAGSGAGALGVAACADIAVWQDTVWCATRHGVLHVSKRRVRRANTLRDTPTPLRAVHVMHPSLYAQDVRPCESHKCGPGAVCVARAGRAGNVGDVGPEGDVGGEDDDEGGQGDEGQGAGYACICIDGLESNVKPDGTVECSVPTFEVNSVSKNASMNEEASRCVGHCRRGECQLDRQAETDLRGQLPLKCVCPPGYSGARCERVEQGAGRDEGWCAHVVCENGGKCKQLRKSMYCVCAPGYEGNRCEQCSGVTACPAGRVCRRRAGYAVCDPPVPPVLSCTNYCLNQGTCTMLLGLRKCACGAGWRGERCELHVNSDNHPAGTLHVSESSSPLCTAGGECAHGGRCVLMSGVGGARGEAACVCAGGGAWGGARCLHYVGRDHACDALKCSSSTVCVWRVASVNPIDAGVPYCACPATESCGVWGAAGAGQGAAQGGGAGWELALSLSALLVLAAIGVYLLYKRQRNSFSHLRLSDNVEINNPMYLGAVDDNDPDTDRHKNGSSGGGNHFANPVYESMYTSQAQPSTEEQATLLEEMSGESPAPPPTPTPPQAPPERAALL